MNWMEELKGRGSLSKTELTLRMLVAKFWLCAAIFVTQRRASGQEMIVAGSITGRGEAVEDLCWGVLRP